MRYPIDGKEAYSFRQELNDKKERKRFKSCTNRTACTLENNKEIFITSDKGMQWFFLLFLYAFQTII